MNVAALFFHNMQATSPGWFIDGDVTDEQRNAIDAIFSPHVEKEMFGGFNTWIVLPSYPAGTLMVRRFTWDLTVWWGTPEEIAQKVADYYNPKEYDA